MRLWLALGLACGIFVGALGALWWWSGRASEGEGFVEVRIADASSAAVFDELGAAGSRIPWLPNPWLLRATKALFFPNSEFATGEHWLPRGASARTLLHLLFRDAHRPVVKVVFPEGWDSFQYAERLAETGVCSRSSFLSRVHDPEAARTRVGRASHEGYLYPATYEFRQNSTPEGVIERLVSEALQRFDAVFEMQEERLARLQTTAGLREGDLVTLASVVQKEAAGPEEYGLIAGVFLRRLQDPDFRPLHVLQSDPTAAYGCKRQPELPACVAAAGRVTREIQRDGTNPYNTYRNAGLPPGPIGNPSRDALRATIEAPPTDYLFFFAPRGGKHTFSRTLAEHNGAIGRSGAAP